MKHMPYKIFLGLLPALLLLSGASRPPHHTMPHHTAPGQGFALVELYTSEGCSSCPAAEEIAATLPKKYPSGVYLLSFHVDYWDRLGWKDPFSNASYTLRQKQYAELLNLSSLYTPQVIVNGRTEMVGSDEPRVRKAIETQLAATTNVSIEANAHSAGNGTVTVDYALTGKSQGNLQAALVQLQASTAVKNGENAGRQLHHVNIVRDLSTSGKAKGSITLTLPPDLTPADCKVILFLQDKDNLNVGGARLIDIH
jgi:hypothetical protein